MTGVKLPPLRLEIFEPERRAPGMMVFYVRPGGSADGRIHVGWLIAIDLAGATVFCNPSFHPHP